MPQCSSAALVECLVFQWLSDAISLNLKTNLLKTQATEREDPCGMYFSVAKVAQIVKCDIVGSLSSS